MANPPGRKSTGDEKKSETLTPRFRKAIQEAYNRFPEIKARFDRSGIKPHHLRRVKELEDLPLTEEFHVFSELTPGQYGWTQALSTAGIKADDIVQICLESDMAHLSMALDWSLSEIDAQSLLSGMANLDIQMDIMKSLKVKAFIGRPDFLLSVAKWHGINGPLFGQVFSLESAIIIGEHFEDEQRVELERKLGIGIVKTHHTQGFYCLGFECRHRTGYHWPDTILVDIVDRESGRPAVEGRIGDLVVTASSYSEPPLIRFNTLDPAYLLNEVCPCGRRAYRLA